jgi:hypothetical protein
MFLLLLLGNLGAATALPIFTHTTDGMGLYTISADATNEPIGLAGLNVDNIIGSAIGSDYGINYSDYFSILDSDSDGLLQFTFSNTGNLTELTGIAFYLNKDMEAFTYSLADVTVDNVSEPSTLLLFRRWPPRYRIDPFSQARVITRNSCMTNKGRPRLPFITCQSLIHDHACYESIRSSIAIPFS